MAKLFQRLLAGVLASAAITGGTAAYVEAQPGGVYHARLPGLEAFAEKVPAAVRFDLMTARVNEPALAESAGGALPGRGEWAEDLQVLAYDAAGNLVGNFFPDAEDPNYSIVEFDENGNKVHSAVYMGEELLTESAWAYDANDRETSWKVWIDGALSSAETYAYTPQPDGTLLCSITTRWPQTGQVTESSYLTNSTGQFLMSEEDGTRITWIYDHRGRPTSHLVSKDNRTQLHQNYSYTDAPDGSYLCRYESYENGNLDSRTEQRFDALGACIYQAEYNRVGEMIYETTAQTMDI